MRLTQHTCDIIRQTVRELFGPGATVSLFGSRVDDSARGGDIDLLVETSTVVENQASAASRLAARLQMQLGDQRIDVLLLDPVTREQPIHSIARETGIRL